MDWAQQATELLHDGESVREQVPVGEGGVVVTSHRLLVFTPEGDGANFRQVDRPNVESVEAATSGEGRFLVQGLKAAVVGVVMIACGYVFNFDQFAEDIALGDTGGAASAVGVGQLLGVVGTFIELLAQLDDLLRILGSLALLLGIVVLGVYMWSRERLLVVTVAGGDDVELPAPEAGSEALLDRLRTAIRAGGPTPSAAGGDDAAAPDGTDQTDPLGSTADMPEGVGWDGEDETVERSESGGPS